MVKRRLYNIATVAAQGALAAYSRLDWRSDRPKLTRFADGRRGLMERIEREMSLVNGEYKRPVAWFHAASLGEYAIARPLIASFAKRGYHTVLTFFSPSGYEGIDEKSLNIDHVFYLPIDTPGNARRFLDAVHPSIALFMVSEYWFNLLDQLKERKIPTYLISAKINENSVFFRPYGALHRRCLACFTRIFVLNESSRRLLAKLGIENVTVSGDPLFENAIAKRDEPWSDPIVERFVDYQGPVVVAGSIHERNDIELIARAVDVSRWKHIIVPHEITDDFISSIEKRLTVESVRYSNASEKDLTKVKVLIIDKMGMLAYLYRYGNLAYVGGGFTPYLHSVVEAVVYGVPVAFGPRIERKPVAEDLIKLGIGEKVDSAPALIRWYRNMMAFPETYGKLRERALNYVENNSSSTEKIIDEILS